MTQVVEIRPPESPILSTAYAKFRQALEEVERELEAGVPWPDGAQPIRASLVRLLRRCHDYQYYRVQQMRLTEPMLTDILFEARLTAVRESFERLARMLGILIDEVDRLRSNADPRLEAASVLCLLKAECVAGQIREVLARESESARMFVSDWGG